MHTPYLCELCSLLAAPSLAPLIHGWSKHCKAVGLLDASVCNISCEYPTLSAPLMFRNVCIAERQPYEGMYAWAFSTAKGNIGQFVHDRLFATRLQAMRRQKLSPESVGEYIWYFECDILNWLKKCELFSIWVMFAQLRTHTACERMAEGEPTNKSSR